MEANTDSRPTSAPAGEETMSLSWQPPAGMIGLSFTNMLLRVITVGIYHFWAKTEVRQRIWSGTRINDEPLTYTGRGLELFLGFLIVSVLIFIPVAALYLGMAFTLGPNHPANHVVTAIVYVVFGFLFGLAIYRAQRYRLSRTRWRGIRGALDGSPVRYAWTFFWTALLIPLTLGWIMPWRSTKLQSIMTNNTRFGDRPVRFDAKSRPLYGPFAIAWIGTIVVYLGFLGLVGYMFYEKFVAAKVAGIPHIPSAREVGIVFAALLVAGLVVGLVSAWYRARSINHFANHTHFENASFSGNLTAFGLIWISVTNFLIMILGGILLGAIITLFVTTFVGFPDNAADAAAISPIGRIVPALIPLAFILGLSLFAPIIQSRATGYLVRNLSVTGTAPLDEIAQTAASDPTFGEGLAEAFDIDAV